MFFRYHHPDLLEEGQPLGVAGLFCAKLPTRVGRCLKETALPHRDEWVIGCEPPQKSELDLVFEGVQPSILLFSMRCPSQQ
eukprot:1859557-Amphidinium_carterae.1